MAKLSAAAFAAFCLERLAAKDGYIMGAVGQDPKTLSSWYFNQYSGSQYTKAIYWKNHAERVWDCQGLSEGYVSEKTGTKVNVRARNNYASWCKPKGGGMIPSEYRMPGAAVFWGNTAGTIHHVAYLVAPVDAGKPGGDWYLVEARGVNYGVVKTKLLSRKPNFWGLMDKYFDYEASADSANASEPGAEGAKAGFVCTGDSVNVRVGPGTNYESVGRLYKDDAVTVVDATGWTPIVWTDGSLKWMSAKYMKEV